MSTLEENFCLKCFCKQLPIICFLLKTHAEENWYKLPISKPVPCSARQIYDCNSAVGTPKSQPNWLRNPFLDIYMELYLFAHLKLGIAKNTEKVTTVVIN